MLQDRIIHITLWLLLPPLLFGVINKTKAFFAGRKGSPLFQTYFDLFKLFRKGLVVSNTTTWFFQAGPVVGLSIAFVVGMIMPFNHSPGLFSFTGDFILFAYLLGLSRFFTTAAALDTGSAFEGMGASREVTFAILIEPALFFLYLVFVKLTGSLQLNDMLHATMTTNLFEASLAPLILILLGLCIIILAENCRIPVDDPNTHLELTMIHEVMVLDHSGPLFGLIEYASSLKLFIMLAMLTTIVTPIVMDHSWLNWVIFVGEILILSVGIGIIESIMARLRMRQVPLLLASAVMLCGSALILFAR